ncbi:hypothetical protein HDV05_008174 [Chytridiales sp. JEL 0842]|nr:hypothetical protein HDV05_008174 [Chytridiales sp. JEL 0842]
MDPLRAQLVSPSLSIMDWDRHLLSAPPPVTPLPLNGGVVVVPGLSPTTRSNVSALAAKQKVSQSLKKLFHPVVLETPPMTPQASLNAILEFGRQTKANIAPPTPQHTPMSNTSADYFDNEEIEGFSSSNVGNSCLNMDDCLFDESTEGAEDLLKYVMFDTETPTSLPSALSNSDAWVSTGAEPPSTVVTCNSLWESLVADLGLDNDLQKLLALDSILFVDASKTVDSQTPSLSNKRKRSSSPNEVENEPNKSPKTSSLDTLKPIPIEGVEKKMYKCPLCPHTQARRFNIKTHLKTHQTDREKKHWCGVCGKGYLRSYELERHQKVKGH